MNETENKNTTLCLVCFLVLTSKDGKTGKMGTLTYSILYNSFGKQFVSIILTQSSCHSWESILKNKHPQTIATITRKNRWVKYVIKEFHSDSLQPHLEFWVWHIIYYSGKEKRACILPFVYLKACIIDLIMISQDFKRKI